MRAIRFWLVAVIVVSGTYLGGRVVSAADSEISVTTVPMSYVFVNKNGGKFSAHHWMKEGYVGGVKEFSGHATLSDGTTVSGEGHALIDANDIGTELSIKKEQLGFLDFDYSEFRKYFDTHAEAYRRFTTLQAPDTDKDLRLNIGKFGFETGLTLENLPELGFSYEREFKNGAKSRLTWTAVQESADARKTGPSWQEIDETVDSFSLKAHQEVAGFNIHGEQRWEQARSENLREEDNLSTTSGANTVIHRQNQVPISNLLTTTLGGERSFLNDKVFVSSGYNFSHIKNSEFETVAEYDDTGALHNYTYPEQEPNNHANSHYDSHVWVENLVITPWKALSLGTKLRSEVIKRHSNSTRNHDSYKTDTLGNSNAPDGVIDYTDYNLADTKAMRWGEQFSVRFSGIPRTALYTELELEQTRLLLREDEKTRDIPIIFLTCLVGKNEIGQGEKIGGNLFIAKPNNKK